MDIGLENGVKVTISSGSHPWTLTEAHNRKIESYKPLLAVLQDYVDSGWAVCVLPWVVGVQGMFLHDQTTNLNKGTGVPQIFKSQMGTRNRRYYLCVCGRANIHAPNTVLCIQSI
jgi:hypothetical protein